MQKLKLIAIIIALLILAAGALLPIHTITPSGRTGIVYRQNRITGHVDYLIITGEPKHQK